MPRFGPLPHREIVRALLAAGFVERPGGAKHQIMRRGDVTVRVPNPHRGDISVGLLARLLRDAGISREEWERL